ncbi:5-oxoprolinase subunit PxpB [Neobacillus drentensis]|uniref:5-oxoprolinase subunit PxpB n=1 Tax=Neobacillus drentensis TaxID=220684 RepID=UPI001F2F6C4B|nr:5-oxoprolinase subunit PxpB [Neobacillus drentensis]ULT56226.1 5-oxoprolinase subunit PxpB [Neobacillus drentensis]
MIEIKSIGDLSIQVSFGNQINEEIHREIQRFIAGLKESKIKGIIEWVPAYCTVVIYYQPEVISYHVLEKILKSNYSNADKVEREKTIVYEIPVYYGGETGPDLPFVASYHQLSEEEVVSLHSSQEYLIYMMGFVPGFPYLGGLPPSLAVPRLEHPRPSVQAGAVGIGGDQTGIYPTKVPSGWRIIGITPVTLFDINRPSPFLFSAGNYIKFRPIDFKEYKKIQRLIANKTYELITYKREKKYDCD